MRSRAQYIPSASVSIPPVSLASISQPNLSTYLPSLAPDAYVLLPTYLHTYIHTYIPTLYP